jgi:hypothetical protein
MDALSSQANISGYEAAIFGVQHLPQILPMMVTPFGTISPARVFVIGAGVAGLQVITTAKRLGGCIVQWIWRSRKLISRNSSISYIRYSINKLGYSAFDLPGYHDWQHDFYRQFACLRQTILKNAQPFHQLWRATYH